MGALHSCCWRSYCHLDDNLDDKTAVLRYDTSKTQSTRTQNSRASMSSHSDPSPGQEGLSWRTEEQEWVPWSSPSNPMGDAESDGELQAFITMRNEADTYTEEWEKLNYDIHSLRYTKREISSRWKKILTQLGYQREVDSLLTVNRQLLQTTLSESDNLNRARQLLQTTLDHSSLFPRGVASTDRYLFVMDRLVSLDSAEDFIRLAKEKYPKREV
ncbi:melanoregulin-like [Salvelinus fontinalis]|uniref:melanoregulin-like n=1 Tax=Salvelinus fontinalis TaxID=8038 RepID=UPI0024860F22|nr:melanoregulin-like [Salvelinus fontinalis]XP_055767789.1 melanoregulin-like [Salvelinus fontinalis]